MAKFVKHESCPSCGSRDNLGRYSDDSAWCFGCGYFERSSLSPFVGERDGQIEINDNGVEFPRDSESNLDSRGLEWLARYDIRAEEALRAGFKWSPYWEQLLMPFRDRDGQLCCIQAKNFNPKRASKAKYYNVGNKAEHHTIYGKQEKGQLVLTEDAVSSLKVGRQSDSMPLLGTYIAKDRLVALKAVYQQLVVWLDSDKWREARSIADAAKLLGFDAKTILTPLDPKEYSDNDIRHYYM